MIVQCIKRFFSRQKTVVRYIAIDSSSNTLMGGRAVTVCSHAFHNKADAMEYLGVGDSQVVKVIIKVG